MTALKIEKKEKTEQIWFRVSEEFKKDLDKWIEYHANYNTSTLIRELLENKIYSDGSIKEEVSPMEMKMNIVNANIEGISIAFGKLIAYLTTDEGNKDDIRGLSKYMGNNKSGSG